MAANNGDTLGEAVISIIRNEFRTRQQRKISTQNNNQELYYIIINYLFQ
jgi:hypothetical protein